MRSFDSTFHIINQINYIAVDKLFWTEKYFRNHLLVSAESLLITPHFLITKTLFMLLFTFLVL